MFMTGKTSRSRQPIVGPLPRGESGNAGIDLSGRNNRIVNNTLVNLRVGDSPVQRPVHRHGGYPGHRQPLLVVDQPLRKRPRRRTMFYGNKTSLTAWKEKEIHVNRQLLVLLIILWALGLVVLPPRSARTCLLITRIPYGTPGPGPPL
jgi:hypothetical protein